MGGKKIIRGCP